MSINFAITTNAVRRTALLMLVWIPAAVFADDAGLTLTTPSPWQVFQRTGYDPSPSRQNDKDSRGEASVPISGKLAAALPNSAKIEYRIVPTLAAGETTVEWTTLTASFDAENFHAVVVVPAGGWYRLEVRVAGTPEQSNDAVSVEPFGVGEVFLVAGQSYATNTNDERLVVQDPQQRVVALNTTAGTWNVANDPQPAGDGSDGGSIWPAVGDLLVSDLQVPVAFANVAVGGTSSAQWLPDGALHNNLIKGGTQLKLFRAVLWQQGESDVIEKTTGDKYVANLKRIRTTAVEAWGFEPVWLAAKSTLHPTVYNDPDGEARIRDAIEQLAAIPGFGAGPDTDTLAGENRGDAKSRRHFSAIGQRNAAALWHKTLMDRIRSNP